MLVESIIPESFFVLFCTDWKWIIKPSKKNPKSCWDFVVSAFLCYAIYCIQQHASLNAVIFLCIEMLEETVAAEKDQVVDENVVDTEQPIGL